MKIILKGYELVGKPSVTCGKNGRWSGDFPICKKRQLCPKLDVAAQVLTRMQINYKNLMKVDNREFATIDSLANYSCISRKSNKIIIGSQVRICSKRGYWSGTDPYCMSKCCKKNR